jgi:UDPglucose 6-dehydrogenase
VQAIWGWWPAGFADLGHTVICADIDEHKTCLLSQGKIPIFEPGLEEMVRRNSECGRLSFTTEMRQAIKNSLAIFLAVGTNSQPDGEADLSQVWSACELIAETMTEYKVVVIRSTVPVGTAASLEARIRQQLVCPVEFDVVSNPEFLREGSAVEDFFHPNRIVIGSSSDRAAAIMKDLYRSLYLIETPFVFTTWESAELIKYAANAFLGLKISFVNELANLCDAVGPSADVQVIANALGLDRRIGPKFLHSGVGFGGSCLPKDSLALIRIAQRYGQEFRTVEAAITVNRHQYLRAVDKLKRGLGPLRGKVITVLGVAFKPNSDDVRESRALKICEALLAEQCEVRVFDPVAMDNARRNLNHHQVTYCSDSYEAVSGCDAVVIATEWNEFRNLDLHRVKQRMRGNVLVDAKNVFNAAQAKRIGFHYYGMGRS